MQWIETLQIVWTTSVSLAPSKKRLDKCDDWGLRVSPQARRGGHPRTARPRMFSPPYIYMSCSGKKTVLYYNYVCPFVHHTLEYSPGFKNIVEWTLLQIVFIIAKLRGSHLLKQVSHQLLLISYSSSYISPQSSVLNQGSSHTGSHIPCWEGSTTRPQGH